MPAYASSNYDLTNVSELTADQLQPFMHPETQHLADQVVSICADQGISAEFIVAVMRLERNVSIHNYFGWSWGDGSLVVFDSDEECLQHCIPLIKENYLTDGGMYFNGYTVKDVSIMYNNSEFWREFISAEIEWILSETSAQSTSPSVFNAEHFIEMYRHFIHVKT